MFWPLRVDLTTLISAVIRLGASREEIANDASATEAKYQLALKQVQDMTALAEVLICSREILDCLMLRIGSNNRQIFKSTLENRKKRWEIFRSHISSRAKAQFTYLLSERSFRGRLLTNHQDKLLDLQVRYDPPLSGSRGASSDAFYLPQVEPDITKDDSTGRGAKTLSGGEKSFSQICLLLALWEAMGSPIRCLDELCVSFPPPS